MKNCICRLMIFTLLSGTVLTPTFAQAPRQTSDTNYGRVTVGKPKIWSFDRIHSTLDGLLRDIDAVQLASLTGLNANESNQALLDFLSTSLNIKVDFSQRAAVLNGLELEKVNAVRPAELQRLQVFNERMRQAEARRVEVERQLAEARDRLAKLDPNSTNYERDKGIEEGKITALTTERTELGTILSQAAPSVTSVDTSKLGDAQGIQPTALPTPLINASDLKDALKAKFNAKDPSLPATKQLDNFVTLLQERLSRQLSISFDDNAREKKLYLVQFDVGIYPQKDSENHVLRVEFDISRENGANAPLAYDLYPGVSAYNMTEYWGKSRGTGIAGSASFLFGFGLGAEYKRQRDQVRSAMTQSVYISGFGAGTSKFGWYFGPSPFEKLISPGNRTAYAVIALDKNSNIEELTFTPHVKWVHRTKADDRSGELLAPLTVTIPDPQLTITRLAYQTKYSPGELKQGNNGNLQQGGNGNGEQPKAEEFGTIQITFAETIDPNLVITINGAVLKRLRDVRGRATAQKSATTNEGNNGPKTSTFGLLETDNDNESHWFALGTKSISLKLAKSLVGSEVFPSIRLLSAGNTGMELLTLLQRRTLPIRPATSRIPDWDIQINEWRFNSTSSLKTPPSSVFVPLFSTVDYVDDVIAWIEGDDIKITRSTPLASQVPLDDYTQVVLIRNATALNPVHIPLKCQGYRELTCSGHGTADPTKDRIAVEHPARNGVLGIASKNDLQAQPPSPKPQLTGGYEVTPIVRANGDITGWHVRVAAKHLQPADDELQGFGVLPPEIKSRPSLVKSSSQLTFGTDANYRVEQNGIEFWIPATSLDAVIQSRLSLSRNGEFRFYLPEMASKLFPTVSNITKEAGSFALKGTRLSLVEQVVFRGCGRECEGIRFGISNGLISFSSPRTAAGVFPIVLRLRGGVMVEAANQNGETWSIVLQPEQREDQFPLLIRPQSVNPVPQTNSSRSIGKESQIFLLSPQPKPSITPQSELERRTRPKQTTIQ